MDLNNINFIEVVFFSRILLVLIGGIFLIFFDVFDKGFVIMVLDIVLLCLF